MQKGTAFSLSVLCLYPRYTYLNVCAQFLEDLIDLILEPSTQHLISFIQNKHLDIFWGCVEMWCQKSSFICERSHSWEYFWWTWPVILTQVCSAKHVIHTSWCAYHYVRGLSLELLYFATEVCSPDAGMAGRPHVVTQSQNDLLDLMSGDSKNTMRMWNRWHNILNTGV